LATDNEIFAERTKESDSLRDHIKELEQDNLNLSEQLKDVLEKLKKHDEQLLKQQVQLNKQMTPRENGIADGMELAFLTMTNIRHFWVASNPR
jgi:septal ring factor EnvC (AmiA/AmiB activator)